jgi:hypothetical protein
MPNKDNDDEYRRNGADDYEDYKNEEINILKSK